MTLADILDNRAYERVREEYRARVIELKKRRRVGLGPFMTALFECPETVRFQVQEMVRAEGITTDDGVQAELDMYRSLLPSIGELALTLFLELRTDDELRRWLPLLVGIESHLVLEIGSRSYRAHPEPTHAAALTRESATAALHYLRISVDQAGVAAMHDGPAALLVDHPEYEARSVLAQVTRVELKADLEGRSRLDRLVG